MTARQPLDRRTLSISQLMREHPPRFKDANKRAVFSAMLRPGTGSKGHLELTHWGAAKLPQTPGAHRAELTVRPGFFVYGEPVPAGTMAWHLNFADHDAFCFYSSGLLAQDELQALEHPVLGALREASVAEGFSLLCTQDDLPTPVLVAGAERLGKLHTAPTAERPDGLYGNAFAPASSRDVLAALTLIDPPTISNILALEAPKYGSGPYRRETIERILVTAYSGFTAAVSEVSRRAGQANANGVGRCVVHTGFWGAGVFGGDPELMALLQFVAADFAGVSEVVFYSGQRAKPGLMERARERHRKLREAPTTEALIEAVLAHGYVWGKGTGE